MDKCQIWSSDNCKSVQLRFYCQTDRYRYLISLVLPTIDSDKIIHFNQICNNTIKQYRRDPIWNAKKETTTKAAYENEQTADLRSVSQQATILKQGSRNVFLTMLKPKQRRFKSCTKKSTKSTFRNMLIQHPPLFLIGCGFGWRPT